MRVTFRLPQGHFLDIIVPIPLTSAWTMLDEQLLYGRPLILVSLNCYEISVPFPSANEFGPNQTHGGKFGEESNLKCNPSELDDRCGLGLWLELG